MLAEGQTLMNGCGITTRRYEPLHSDLDANVRVDVVMDEIAHLNEHLVEITDLADETRSAAEKDYLVRLGDWENGLYKHRLEQVTDPSDALGKSLQAADLQAYLQRKHPQWKDLKIVAFAPLAGGFSKNTIFFETEDAANGRQAMVMRAQQGTELLDYAGSDVTQEFYTIQLMRRAGLPVAEPLWLEEDASQLGMRFIVSRKAVGKTQGGNLGSETPVSDQLLRSIMATLIKLHSVRLDPDDPLVKKSHLREWISVPTVAETTRYCVNEFIPQLARKTDIAMTPQLLRGLKWLQRNVPQIDEPAAILHIDFAFNNLIIDNEQITAVLDWESSRLGDPAEDIIWTQRSLASHISLPKFLKQYEQGTGRHISEYRLAYAKVLKCALNAICCLSAQRILDRDDMANISLGTLGLRYMAIFGSQFNALIDEAESVRDR
jgi:aminoglycoside phosphotransferase (APT) family kinase protein